MNLLWLALIGLGLFLILSFLRRWFDGFILIAFCIGALCNANYYNAVTCPIELGGIIYGVDSILYTLFLFTIVVKYLHYSLKEAKNMAIAAIVAVAFAALIEFLAKVNSCGYDKEYLVNCLCFLFTGIASLIAVFLMMLFLEKSKKVNRYLRIAIAIFIGSIVNSTIYYFLAFLVQGSMPNFWNALFGSYIGKTYAIGLSLLAYFLNGTLFPPTDLNKINHHSIEQ